MIRDSAGTWPFVFGSTDLRIALAAGRGDRGENPTQIAKALGVSRASVFRYLGGAGQKA